MSSSPSSMVLATRVEDEEEDDEEDGDYEEGEEDEEGDDEGEITLIACRSRACVSV